MLVPVFSRMETRTRLVQQASSAARAQAVGPGRYCQHAADQERQLTDGLQAPVWGLHAPSARSTARLASSRLLKNWVGCGMALGKWDGGGHRRSSVQAAVHPPMSLRLMEQSACPSTLAIQVVGGLWSQVTCAMAPSHGC